MDSPVPDGKERFLTAPMIAALAVSTLLLALNYLAFPEFGSFGNENSIQWLISSWNKQTDYEHGWLVVPIIVFMLYHARKKIAQAPRRMDWRGLILFIPAIMLLMLSFRVGQPRVAVGALPLILLGGAWYLAGPQTARLCAFPLLFFWLCIPLPSFQQATVGLQIIATELGHWGASIFGVDTYRRTLGCLQYCRRVQRHAFPDGTAHAVRSLGLPVRLEILEKMRALPQRDSPGRHRQRCPHHQHRGDGGIRKSRVCVKNLA